MFEHILVVCIGNICRSPVAQAMLADALPNRQVESAGLGALTGHGADPSARALGEAEGLNLADHQARQLTTEMLRTASLILVMSEGQRRAVGELAPEVLGKTMRLGRWLDEGRGLDIPDPYRKSPEAFEHVHQLLKDATGTWVARL